MALKEKLIDKAQKFIQKGYLEKAVVEYRAAADVDPKDISIRLRIGDLYVKLGKKSEAVKEYTEAARANAQRGFYLKAIAVYKQVLKLEENLDTHNKLAELYLKQRLIADAVGEYSYIVHWYENRGKTSEVLELLKKMVDIDPENVGVRLKLADLYQKLSFAKDSLFEYSIIFEKLLSAGKLDKAEKVYLSLYNANPSEERVLSGLSELYRIKGDDTQRLKFLKGLFNYYSVASMAEEARRAAQDIIRINPDDPHASRFLKKDEKTAPQAAQHAEEPAAFSIAASIEVPDGVEQNASEEPVVSWPEEEIEITIEGFEEAGAEAESAPLPESLPEVSEAALEVSAPENSAAAGVSPELAAQVSHAGSADEIDIDIDDLLRGDLPRMGADETPVEPAESSAEVADAQAPVGESPVEGAVEIQEPTPSVSEVQVEETPEETGIEDVISVISAELQEDLLSGTEKPISLDEPPVEVPVEMPEPVINAQESMEAVEAETSAQAAVDDEQPREAAEDAYQGAAGPEQIVEIESEEIELLEL
ncbi:MAG: tetratricopeptide repeat protein [Deltaproteobacteria bacterium]|nr:tetratricopeptide repeat protein [Deltaproteobacteria bacterium]